VKLTHVGDSQSGESLNLWRPVGGQGHGAAIELRDDFDGAALRRLARSTRSANQARRLLALAEIYDGGSRTAAARIGGVGLQIVRDWVVRFNARGPDGLLDGKAPGMRSLLDDAQRRALVEIVESGPIPAIHGVVRWRLIDLVQWLHEEFAVSLNETTVGRELKKLGYVKLTARPRHGTVGISVCGRAFEHYATMALMKRSPKITANWALAIVHSRGGIFHSFSDRFKIR
jgi:transposase